jgi:hypothetical protein
LTLRLLGVALRSVPMRRSCARTLADVAYISPPCRFFNAPVWPTSHIDIVFAPATFRLPFVASSAFGLAPLRFAVYHCTKASKEHCSFGGHIIPRLSIHPAHWMVIRAYQIRLHCNEKLRNRSIFVCEQHFSCLNYAMSLCLKYHRFSQGIPKSRCSTRLCYSPPSGYQTVLRGMSKSRCSTRLC